MPAVSRVALTLPKSAQSNSTPYMHPLSEALLLTFTVLARKVFFASVLCAFSAIVIEPVTAVHTVAERYCESYLIIMLRAVPYFLKPSFMGEPRYIVCSVAMD